MSKTFKNTAFGNFWSRFKDGFMEGAGKLGNQRHLAALRDAFALFTPLIIVGSLAVVMRTFVFGAAGGAPTSLLGWIANAAGETTPLAAPKIGFDFAAGSAFAVISQIGNFLSILLKELLMVPLLFILHLVLVISLLVQEKMIHQSFVEWLH